MEEYYNPRTGFSSVATMAKRLKLKPTQVQRVLQKLPAYQRTFPSRYRPDTHFQITAPAGSYQMDLVFMPSPRMNKGYVGFLLCIEITTRKVFAYPIKDKTIGSVKPAIEDFIRVCKPTAISSDNESAFMSESIQMLFLKSGIEHRAYRPDDHRAMGILDRVVRTLKDMFQRYFLAAENLKWFDVLGDIIDNYNSRPHRSLDGKTPDEAEDDEDLQDSLRGDALEHNLKTLNKTAVFKPGDKVRTYMPLGNNEKGRPKYSQEVYKVDRLEGLSYRLRNAEGNLMRNKYRPYELVAATENEKEDLLEKEKLRERQNRRILQG